MLPVRAWLCLTVAALVACDDRGSARVKPPVVGRPAPAYRAIEFDGDSVSLDALRGQPVLLNVWATWCFPCREEIPVLQALHERYESRGLQLIGVSVDARGHETAVREFVKDFGMTYSLWHDPDERVQSTFLAVGVPATYLIDRGGILRWRHVGPVRASDTILVQAIERALGSTPPGE
jgi:peroxiredoxin